MKDHVGFNRSLWVSDTLMSQGATLRENIDADVCVIGAGIAGLTTAYLLAKEGRQVIIVDSDKPASGQTARTTAHLSFAIDDRIYEVERIHGREAARLAVESHRAAIEKIESIINEEAIECDFRKVDGYLFVGEGEDPNELDQELEAARRSGLAEVVKLDVGPPNVAHLGPCLRFPHQAQFHPLHYMAGLRRAFLAMGGQIYESTKVAGVQSGPICYVKTEQGFDVAAGAVVVATHSPITNRMLLHTKMHPYLTFVIAIELNSASVPEALFWDTSDPYHYVRRSEHAGETLLIVGGEDHKTGENDLQKDPYRNLEIWARERFPGLGKVRFHWSGQVMETLDGLAFIGPNPLEIGNVYVACGDSGMGMTHGTIAGILLTDQLQGRTNPWTEIYRPSRIPLKATGEFLFENLDLTLQYRDYFTAGEVSSDYEIPRGSGAILRKGLHKIAVYRSSDGELHSCSAVCPHLAGLVRWNDDEKTWDCPVHGSRFSPLGKCIQGPAYQDLAPEITTTRPLGRGANASESTRGTVGERPPI